MARIFISTSPSKSPILPIVLLMSMVCSSRASSSWNSTGPSHKNIKAVSISPQDTNIVYAGAFGWGVFKSTDGGISWITARSGLKNLYVRSILAVSNTVVYCGTNDGVSKSTDGGTSWTTSLMTAYSVRDIAVDPITNSLYAATFGSGLFKSTNQGSSWISEVVSDPVSGQTLSRQWSVAVCGMDSLYVGGSILDIASGGALFKSIDGGANWVQVQRGIGIRSSVHSIAISANSPDVSLIIGTATKGVYKSTNGGVNWTEINGSTTPNPLIDKQINAVGFSPNYRYAGTDSVGGFFFRELGDTAIGWLMGTGLPGSSAVINSITINPMNPNRILVGTEGQGTFKSVNAGFAWQAKNTGMLGVAARSIKINGNGNLILGTDFGDGIWISTNMGVDWSKAPSLPTSNPITSIEITNNPSVLYAGAYGGGVFKSVDGGSNWTITDSTVLNHFVRAVRVNPSDLNTVYAGTGNGVYKTTTGGTSWGAVNSGIPPNSSIRSMEMDPANSNVLYAGTDSNYLYKTTDGGTSWSHLTNVNGFFLQDTYIRSITIDYSSSNTVYVGADSGRIYKSINAGSAWTLLYQLPASGSVRSIHIHPNIHNVFFAATFGDGIFVSVDSGSHWSQFNAGLTDSEVYCLESDNASPLNLYAGSGAHGVFHTEYTFSDRAPVLSYIGNKSVLMQHQLAFSPAAFDSDATTPALTVSGLPSGAAFSDSGNGHGIFTWVPTGAQVGQYFLTFVASDGTLADSEVVRIDVLDSSTSAVIDLPVESGWNLVSVPVTVNNNLKTVLFSTATSSAFGYAGTYAVRDTLLNGVGYWLKFGSNQIVESGGGKISNDTITIRANWNMIGSVSSPISTVTQIQPIPPLSITSNFFGYASSSGYYVADSVKSGRAYWMKADRDGKIILSAPSSQPPAQAQSTLIAREFPSPSFADMNRISFIDGRGRKGDLYFSTVDKLIDLKQFELPPLPPVEGFDVRFETGRMAEITDANERTISILVSAATYPLTVRWQMQSNIGQAELLADDKNIVLYHSAELQIARPFTQFRLRLSPVAASEYPKVFSLERSYPNPFNPKTMITYNLPAGEVVHLTVHNVLGQQVADLVDGFQQAGHKSVEWNADGLPSGIYYYILRAYDPESGGLRYHDVGKTVLLK